MVSSYLPYPLKSGGDIRLYNLIKNLSKDNDITLICEKRDYQIDSDLSEVEKICKKVLTVSRKKQWTYSNILKTGFSRDPFLLVGHKSDEMRNIIRDELVKESYDLIHVETFYVLQNVPRTHLPIILVEHNIEYLVYKRFADLSNPLIRPLLYLDVLKIKRKETEAWNRAEKLVAVSETEKKLMKKEATVVPNGVNINVYKFRNFEKIPEEKRILFIGDFKWIQNKDSLKFILEEIWPNVRKELNMLSKKIDTKLWVVGRNMPEEFKKYAAKDVILDYKNDEEANVIFAKSYLLLAPLRVAGGTSYKILEAFASGTGVVTTGLGVEGLSAKNGIQVLTAESSINLANCVVNLLTDTSLYRKLTHNARNLVEENYTWEKISDKLQKVYMSSL